MRRMRFVKGDKKQPGCAGSPLLQNGWGILEVDDVRDMLRIAVMLGVPGPSRTKGPLIDILMPLSQAAAQTA